MPLSLSLSQPARVVASAFVGNLLEWYDFALFLAFAPQLSQAFFGGSDSSKLLNTYVAFAVSFLMRPLGGIFFGWLTDSRGRKPALMWTVLLMAVSCLAIALTPKYDSIGALAPLLFFVSRALQGFSVGGELVASAIYTAESAPKALRATFGSSVFLGIVGGICMGYAVASLALATSPPALIQWGVFRLPFLSGMLVGFMGIVARRVVNESRHFKPQGGSFRQQIREVLQPAQLKLIIAFTAAISWHAITIYVGLWVAQGVPFIAAPDVPDWQRETATILGQVTFLFLCVPACYLSDRLLQRGAVSRFPMMAAAAAASSACSFVVLGAARDCSARELTARICVYWAFLAFFVPIEPALMVELFPQRCRGLANSIAYNIALAIFGGLVPLMCTALVNKFDTLHSVCVLQCCVCVMSLLGLKYCHDHMARLGSAADDDDAAVIDECHAAGDAAALEAEMGSAEGDKSRLIHAA